MQNKLSKIVSVIIGLLAVGLILVVSGIIVPKQKLQESLQDVKGVQSNNVDENQILLDSTKDAVDFSTDYMTVANYSSKETLVELETLETLPLETKMQVSSVAQSSQNSSQILPEIISSTSSSVSIAKSIKLGADCNANYTSKPTSCSLFDENNNFKLSVLTVGKVTLESKNDQYQIIENVYSNGSKKTRIVYKYYFATNKIFKIFHESSILEYCKQYCTLIK